jgi:tRNA nucleotidyltransferase (CCA-adding enzyme)
MKTFQRWIIESSLRQQLQVPQNPKHHPEGPVDRHTMMVRASLQSAISVLKTKQKENPNGPLSNLDLDFNDQDINILRFASLLHDIGKGDALDPKTLSAHGHEDPSTFEKAMLRLSPSWYKMYQKADPKDREDLWWVIKYHMSLHDKDGFKNKALKKEILDENGKYKTDRKIKLLLVLLLMDRMGRGGESGVSWKTAKNFAQNNTIAADQGVSGIYTTSDLYRKDLEKRSKNTNQPIGDDPRLVVSQLKQKGRTTDQIRMALAGMTKTGKFNLTPDQIESLLKESKMNFRQFMESQELEPFTMKAYIPLGIFEKGATILNQAFKNANKTFYVVGGTVRDYLMSKYHDLPFEIKDVDFATDALSNEVIQILEKAGIKYVPKGESFGVISAIINNQEFEIATFREESGYEDRRRPSSVKASDAKNDYRRRDFTFNALYYDMPINSGSQGTIIDFGGGKGLEDIKNKRVSPVGSAHDRFAEDPLRVMRGVRFHGIFNTDNLKDIVDPETFEAMKKFSSLEGVSPERIQAEFIASLTKARDPRVILRGFESIGALPFMFPGMELDMQAVDNLQKLPTGSGLKGDDKKNYNNKKVILTLALLLRKAGRPEEIRNKLNAMKWPNDIVDEVTSLIKTWLITQNPNSQDLSQHAISLYKKNPSQRKELIQDFHPLVGHEVDQDHLAHLHNYEPAKFSGEDIQRDLGLTKMGPEIGAEMKRRQAKDYEDSFGKWKNR